jgi:hypothetical protein
MTSLGLTSLPDDVLLEIAKHLDFSSLVQLCAVNRHCHGLFSVDNFGQIWKHVYQRDFSILRWPNSNQYRQVYAKILRKTRAKNLNDQLRYAAKHGYEQLIKSLVKQGVNKYDVAIAEAKNHGYQDIFDSLLKLNGGTYQCGPRGVRGPVGSRGCKGPRRATRYKCSYDSSSSSDCDSESSSSSECDSESSSECGWQYQQGRCVGRRGGK